MYEVGKKLVDAPDRTNDLWNNIPADVKELLFYTNENPKTQNHVMNVGITISFNNDFSANIKYNDHALNDPSTIYFKAPIQVPPDISVVGKLPYMPSYLFMQPEQRYIYLIWLQDISKDIDVGYRFLFYYGLERMLIIGKYEKAFEMIIRLYHGTENSSFRNYSGNSLFYTAVLSGQEQYIERLDFLFRDEVWYSKQILLKHFIGEPIKPPEAVKFIKGLGVNKRYLDDKVYSEQLGNIFSEKYGRFFLQPDDLINKDFRIDDDVPVFANFSFPQNVRVAKVMLPELDTFKITMEGFHKTCHENTKAALAALRKKR